MPTEPRDMTPATRHDVDNACAKLGAELRAELASKEDLRATAAELRAELASKRDLEGWGTRLLAMMREELARHAAAMQEYFRHSFAIADEKSEHTRQDVAAHVADRSIHHTHEPPPRARRKPTRASGRSR